MNAPVDLLIASRLSPTMHGGLAQYQRGLARVFQEHPNTEVLFCAEETPPASNSETPPAAIIMSTGPEDLSRAIWMRMASRPSTHGLLQAWITRTYAPLLRELDTRHPRVIHFVGSGWDFIGFALQALAVRLGARFTIWPAVHPGVWGDDQIDLRLYRLADTVFCQSASERDHLAAKGLDPARTLLCGLPPMCRRDGHGDRFRQRLNLEDRPAVLFLGRRDAGKGYPALLEAWSIVLRSQPQAVLILAGMGDANLPTSLPAEAIRDLGTPDEQEKADALAACDVFCLPSAHESFGIVYPEAWSYGKPVICGTAPAAREWIQNETTGLWADQSPERIARAVLRLFDNPELGHRMGEAGRRFQSEHLTWKTVEKVHRLGFNSGSPKRSNP